MHFTTMDWIYLIFALCWGRTLQSTPDESERIVPNRCLPSSTNPVEIRDCNITTLDADFLVPFSWITTLDMSFNREFDFPSDGSPFLHHQKLMFYHCESCGITAIHERTFAELRQLMLLNLRSNKIGTVHAEAFSYCNLGYLNLANNQIERFNKWHKLEKVYHLMTLDVSGNRQFNLNDLTGDFRSLSWMLCRNCGISTLDERWFGRVSRLIKLDLANNSVEIVPKGSFGELHRLINVNLNYNPVQWLDFANDRLEALSCVGCNLTRLTKNSVRYLPNLKTLDLRINQIATVDPMAFSHNKELKQLQLDDNLLTNFPEEVLRTKNSLVNLCLDNNYFQPSHTFTDFKLLYKSMKLRNNCQAGSDHRYHFERFIPDSLVQGSILYRNDLPECTEHVNISYRNVALIEPMAYANCTLLKIMEMNGNSNFSFYQHHPFLHSESLEEYSCQRCGITALYEHTFTELPMLKILLLQDNPIKSLHSAVTFQKNLNLQILRLDHNQLHEMNTLILHNHKSFKILNINNNAHLSFNLSLYLIEQPSIETLHGVSCAIKQITRYSFSLMPNLTELYLSDNPIAIIDPEAFTNNQQLRILHLARTQLRVFPAAAVNHLEHLSVLCLYGLDQYALSDAENSGNNAELGELFRSRKLHCRAGEKFISRLAPIIAIDSQELTSEAGNGCTQSVQVVLITANALFLLMATFL